MNGTQTFNLKTIYDVTESVYSLFFFFFFFFFFLHNLACHSRAERPGEEAYPIQGIDLDLGLPRVVWHQDKSSRETLVSAGVYTDPATRGRPRT